MRYKTNKNQKKSFPCERFQEFILPLFIQFKPKQTFF